MPEQDAYSEARDKCERYGVLGRLDNEGSRRSFTQLRVDIQTFRRRLRTNLSPSEASVQFDRIESRLAEYTTQTRTDYLIGRLKRKVNEQVQGHLDEEKP